MLITTISTIVFAKSLFILLWKKISSTRKIDLNVFMCYLSLAVFMWLPLDTTQRVLVGASFLLSLTYLTYRVVKGINNIGT